MYLRASGRTVATQFVLSEHATQRVLAVICQTTEQFLYCKPGARISIKSLATGFRLNGRLAKLEKSSSFLQSASKTVDSVCMYVYMYYVCMSTAVGSSRLLDE